MGNHGAGVLPDKTGTHTARERSWYYFVFQRERIDFLVRSPSFPWSEAPQKIFPTHVSLFARFTFRETPLSRGMRMHLQQNRTDFPKKSIRQNLLRFVLHPQQRYGIYSGALPQDHPGSCAGALKNNGKNAGIDPGSRMTRVLFLDPPE